MGLFSRFCVRAPCRGRYGMVQRLARNGVDDAVADPLGERFLRSSSDIGGEQSRKAPGATWARPVGLDGQVRILQGDVMDLPLPDASQDAVVSQEALLHVPDLGRALREAYRVLCPGGRIAFTNWIVHRPLSEAQRQLLW